MGESELINLLDREIGKRAFDLEKELRSEWKVFWYNTVANILSFPDKMGRSYKCKRRLYD